MITINEVPLTTAVAVNKQIPEFGEKYQEIHFLRRLQDKEHLIIVAFIAEQPSGYLIAYNRDADGSVYCWRAAVLPQFRRQGVLRTMMAYLEEWAKSRSYTKIKIKTRNKRRAMLAYLVKYGFNFIRVNPHEPLEESRIYLEKMI